MSKSFDYIIVGGGLAGLQLALAFADDLFFIQKKIAIIDPSKKTQDDKTWCFWEKGEGQWSPVISKTWNSGKFISSEVNLKLNLEPYSYKMIKSLDFYQFAKKKLESAENISFIADEIETIDPVTMLAHGDKNNYEGRHFFDSRVDTGYLEDSKHTRLFQHFKGWVIETNSNRFDPYQFTMMDYRLKFKDSTSFTYVLPFSRTKALIEFTFFTPFLTEEKIYDEYLEKYISEYLEIKNYKKLETEKGIIPMTDYPFHHKSSKRITKIGTAGSWVKGSTGYSFKHTEKKVTKIIENIKKGNIPSQGLINKRFRRYDAVFLDVLNRRNDLGELLFSRFYSKNHPNEIFEYLDEETSIKQDLRIMFSLKHFEFIRSFFRKGIKF